MKPIPPTSEIPEEPAGASGQDLRQAKIFFAAAACILVLFTLFHEEGRLYVKAISDLPYASFYSCVLHSAGALLGALVSLAPPLARFSTTSARTLALALCWMLVATAGCYGVELVLSRSAAGAYLFGTAGSVLCSLFLTRSIAAVAPLEPRTVAWGLAAAIMLCACADYLVFPFAANGLPFGAAALLLPAFAVAALLFCLRWKPLSAKVPPSEPACGERPSSAARREPPCESPSQSFRERGGGDLGRYRALIVHLVSYGFAFGLLHTTVGIFGLLGSARDFMEFFGTTIAAALVLATYLRPVPTAREVWTNLRRLAFPLLTGFVIIPALIHSFLATVFAEAATCYYGCLFVLGCLFMMQQTDIAPSRIAGAGVALLCLGLVVGTVCGFLPYLLQRTDDQLFLSTAIMVAFVATTIGTFWIGDDHALRTWWGLRRRLTPKQYQDDLAQRKCQAVAQAYNLSSREYDVLLLLAQGRRASQIKDDLFISINTVRVHTRNIYNKLDVHSVKQLTDLVESVVL